MKKSTIKKTLALFLTGAMTLAAFTACGEKAPDVSSTPQKSKKEEITTINFWHHYSAQSAENETLTKVLIPKFEEENPGYKVNAASHEWADLHDKIMISASSDTLPDVARLDIAWVPEFQKMDILVPLNKEMSDYDATAKDLLPSAMSTASIKGDQYALALNTNTKILFYNEEALKEVNLEVPKTMDELFAAAKALSGKNKNGQQVWGLNEPALSSWNVLPYIWSNGGTITNEDYTKAQGFVNSKETVAAVQKLVDLYKNGELGGFNSGDIPMTDGFGTGRYMMLLEGPWKTAELAGAYPDFKYGTAGVPVGSAGGISVLGGEDIAMFKSANKEGAWKFIQFMTSDYAQKEMAKCGQIPVNTKTLESKEVKESAFAPFLEAITTAKTRPPVASWAKIDNELTTAMTDMTINSADVQKTLDQLATKIDTLLAE